MLSSLQAHGISVSLNDFGTGYSSLYHLRNLRFDKIKIDRSFVQSLHQDVESAKIVDAVLGLARSLGMPVVAEGVEDEAASAAHLCERGSEYGQGYFYARPMRADDVASLLRRSGGEAPSLPEPAGLQCRVGSGLPAHGGLDDEPVTVRAVA